jgi:hypothetical protein
MLPNERERVASANARVRMNPSPVLSSPTPEGLELVYSAAHDPASLKTFITRGLMYMAYAELDRVAFAPDASRVALVQKAMSQEQDLASQVRAVLHKTWREVPKFGAVDFRMRTSPFSAVLFERCRGDRHAIPDELLRLRSELAPVRDELGDLEYRMLSGSRDAAVQLERRWQSIVGEIDKAFGLSPQLVTLSSGISVAQDAAGILDNATSLSAWVQVLKLPVNVLSRLLLRRPVAQLHRLRKELPGAVRLRSAVNLMFPEMTKDREQ